MTELSCFLQFRLQVIWNVNLSPALRLIWTWFQKDCHMRVLTKLKSSVLKCKSVTFKRLKELPCAWGPHLMFTEGLKPLDTWMQLLGCGCRGSGHRVSSHLPDIIEIHARVQIGFECLNTFAYLIFIKALMWKSVLHIRNYYRAWTVRLP